MGTNEDFIGTATAAKILGLERSVFTRKVLAKKLPLEPAFEGSGHTGEKFYRRSDVEVLVSAAPDAAQPGDAA